MVITTHSLLLTPSSCEHAHDLHACALWQAKQRDTEQATDVIAHALNNAAQFIKDMPPPVPRPRKGAKREGTPPPEAEEGAMPANAYANGHISEPEQEV